MDTTLRPRKTRLVITAFCLLLAPMAQAENLLDIFNSARTNDPKLLAAKAQWEAAKEKKPQQLSTLLPHIFVSGGYTKISQTPIRGLVGIDYTTEALDEYLLAKSFSNQNYSVNLIQPLFNVENFRALKVAELEDYQAELAYRLAQQDLLYRVAEAFFNVLAFQGELDFARAEKNAIAKQLAVTQQKFQVGLIAVTDVHEAQARHDLAVAAEILADNRFTSSQETMREITGDFPKSLVGLKANSPLTAPTPTNVNEWSDAAIAQNLRLAASRLQIQIAEKKVDRERGKHYPTVDFSSYYGQYSYGNVFGASTRDAGLAVTFSMNLYQGGEVSSRIRESRETQKSVEQQLIETQRAVLHETRNAYLNVLAGISYVKALNQSVISSQKALAATEAGFDVGTRSAIDVLDAQRDLFRTQRDYARSRYDYVLNTLKLKKAVGLLTIDDLEQVNDWLL